MKRQLKHPPSSTLSWSPPHVRRGIHVTMPQGNRLAPRHPHYLIESATSHQVIQVTGTVRISVGRRMIRCSTGCTHIPTGAENRSGGDRAERTPTTERVGGIPLPNQIRAETPGMHQTKPHPRSSPRASKRRRCRDTRSVQDEDRGQGRLRINRNSYLEVQDGPGSQRSGRTNRRRRK